MKYVGCLGDEFDETRPLKGIGDARSMRAIYKHLCHGWSVVSRTLDDPRDVIGRKLVNSVGIGAARHRPACVDRGQTHTWQECPDLRRSGVEVGDALAGMITVSPLRGLCPMRAVCGRRRNCRNLESRFSVRIPQAACKPSFPATAFFELATAPNAISPANWPPSSITSFP